MNNKIEKGCLAIVVNSTVPENLGKVVRVGEFVGDRPDFWSKSLWKVDQPMLGTDGRLYYMQAEKNLMRVDNYDEDMYNDEQINQLEKEKVG